MNTALAIPSDIAFIAYKDIRGFSKLLKSVVIDFGASTFSTF